MPAEWIITGGTYVLTAVGGGVIIWFKQWMSDRNSDRKIDRETKHLALDVADILEKYAAASTSVASDIAEHAEQHREGYRLDIAKLPEFPREHERWRDLNLKVADEILHLQDTHRAYETRVEGALDYVDPDDAQEEARILGILLAVRALNLASGIRKRYKHKPFKTEAYWPVYLGEKYDAIPEDRRKAAANSFPVKRWWHRSKQND